MAQYRSIRDLDWAMIIVALGLCALGILQIFSATHDSKWKDAWWKQIIFVVAGMILMWIVAQIDYHTLLGHVFVMYGVGFSVLVGLLVFGDRVLGTKRWIPVMGNTFQASEFFKVVLVLLIARYLTELRSDRLEVGDLLKLGALVGIPLLLVMRQPDLGTSLTYLPILGAGVFLAGLRWQHAAVIFLLIAVVIPSSWFFVLADYQKARLTSFLDPTQDPRGSGYQVIQSKIAVGSGALWGRGPTRGTQTQLRYLPVSHTDFIFSSYAEEHGFVGVIVGMSLYFLLLMQIVQNAQTSPDRAGLYICMGSASLLLFHVLVNVGMVVGRMPVTGIPLPLMSYGGSNVLTVFVLLGLVNNVRLRRFVN